MDYKLLYFPMGAGLAPRPGELLTRILSGCASARQAAQRAASFERRTGARVLAVITVNKGEIVNGGKQG
jgi:hypothetical protein